jgi:hypothetical protein
MLLLVILPVAERLIAPPLPEPEEELIEPVVVSTAPLSLVRAIAPPFPLPPELELT